jgi:hypothetical protein
MLPKHVFIRIPDFISQKVICYKQITNLLKINRQGVLLLSFRITINVFILKPIPCFTQ